MRVLSLALLAASAIGAVSIGSASAMPFANPASAQESLVQDVRVVCDRFGRCYNTNRARTMATGMAIAAAIAAIARTATTEATAITVVRLSVSVLVQWGSASALGRSKLI